MDLRENYEREIFYVEQQFKRTTLNSSALRSIKNGFFFPSVQCKTEAERGSRKFKKKIALFIKFKFNLNYWYKSTHIRDQNKVEKETNINPKHITFDSAYAAYVVFKVYH